MARLPALPIFHSDSIFEIAHQMNARNTLFSVVALILLGLVYLFTRSSAEEKITEAYPVTTEVKVNFETHLAKLDDDGKETFNEEFQKKIRFRAQACAEGFVPGTFDNAEDIKTALADKNPCFIEHDKNITKWIVYQRISALLKAPALVEAKGETTPYLAGDGTISNAFFAKKANVAVLKQSDNLLIVSMTDGKIISSLPSSMAETAELSDNGRLISMVQGSTLKIYSTENGELLLENGNDKIARFQWLNESYAIYSKRVEYRLQTTLIDLDTGVEAPIQGVETNSTFVLPVTNKKEQFMIVAHNSLTKFEIVRSADKAVSTKILQDLKLQNSYINESQLSIDKAGIYYFGGNYTLSSVDPENMSRRDIDFKPFRIDQIVATPETGKVLLSGYSPDGKGRNKYLYNLKNNSLAMVTDESLIASRAKLVPGGSKLAFVSNTKVTIMDAPATDAGKNLLEFKNDWAFAESMRKLEQFERAEQLENSYKTMGAMNNARLANEAKDAKIVGVGLQMFDSRNGSSRGENDYVNIKLSGAKRPVILVLTSTFKSNWVVTADPGIVVKAVIISSSFGGEVMGVNTGKIIRSNAGAGAYQMNSDKYQALDAMVKRETGRGIDKFQGSSRGNSFWIKI